MGIMAIAMIFRAESRKRLSQPLRSSWLKAKEGMTEVNKIPTNGKISSAVFNELIYPRRG